jgi:hypothetical protein
MAGTFNIGNMGVNSLSTTVSQLQRGNSLARIARQRKRETLAMLQGQDDGTAGALHLQHPQHGNHFTERTAF